MSETEKYITLLTGGSMVGAIVIAKKSGFDIVAATRSEMTLWEKSETGYSKSRTAAIECSAIEHIVVEGDDQVACLNSDVWGNHSTLTLFNSNLIKQTELQFGYKVTAIKTNPDGELMIGATNTLDTVFHYDGENTLRIVDPSSGAENWKSRPLLGEITGIFFLESTAGNTYKRALSTTTAMYVITEMNEQKTP